MKLIVSKARLIFCVLIMVAFFLPAHENVSGFSFVRKALSDLKNGEDITATDVFILIGPLLLMQAATLYIFIGSVMRCSIRKTYMILPLLFLGFFMVVLFYTSRNTSGSLSSPEILFQMQIGFFLAGFSSLILIFTKDIHRKSKKRRRSHYTQTVAVPETV